MFDMLPFWWKAESEILPINMVVQFNRERVFYKELVNITFKQGSLGLNEMYLQFLDKVAWISWEKQGNASKYFFAIEEILRIVALPGKYQNIK